MNTSTSMVREQVPENILWDFVDAFKQSSQQYVDTKKSALKPTIVETHDVLNLGSLSGLQQAYSPLTSSISTFPLDAWTNRLADPLWMIGEIASLSQLKDIARLHNRITNLVRAFQAESPQGESPSLLSMKDFFSFMQSAPFELDLPSLSFSASGLLRAIWSHERERVIVQFRGDEDVDYVVVVHHPKHWGKFERKSGRCSQQNLFENLSPEQLSLLTK